MEENATWESIFADASTYDFAGVSALPNAGIPKNVQQKPLISVVMAAYNSSATIIASLNSILKQTIQDFEIIVVDDNSTDDTLSKVLSINDSRIQVIGLKKNLGSGAARNIAIQSARSPYIAILDSDDIAFPNRLETQLNQFLSDETLDIVSSQFVSFNAKGEFTLSRMPTDQHIIAKRIERLKMPIAHCSASFKRSSVILAGGYDEQARRSQDYALILKMGDPKISVVDLPLTFYRHNFPESFSYILQSDRHARLVRKKKRKNDWADAEYNLGLPGSLPSDALSVFRWTRSRFSHLRSKVSKSWLASSTFLTFSRVTGAVLSAIMYLSLARQITVSEFGYLSLWIGIIAWTGVIFDFGLTTYINKAFLVEKNKNAAYEGLLVHRKLSLVFCGFALSVAFLFSTLSTPLMIQAISMVVIWTAIEKVTEAESLRFYFYKKASVPAINLMARRFFACILFFYFDDYMPVVLSFSASFLLSSLVGFLALRFYGKDRKRSQPQLRPTESTGSLIRRSFNYSVSTISLQARDLESLAVSAAGGLAAGGIFSLASRFTNPIFMFTGSLSTLLPREVAERGGIWARSAIQRILWAICAFVCVLLLLIPIASEILVIVFGDQYRNQGLVFVFIAAGSVIYAGIVPINSILQALERQKVVAINAIFRAVTLLSFISVGAFAAGAFGASVAYFSVMVTELFIVSMRLLSKRGRVSIFREGRV